MEERIESGRMGHEASSPYRMPQVFGSRRRGHGRVDFCGERREERGDTAQEGGE